MTHHRTRGWIALRRLSECHLIAACIHTQVQTGQAAVVAAALPGAPGTASLAGPRHVIAREQARHTGELAKLAAYRVQAPGGMMRDDELPGRSPGGD